MTVHQTCIKWIDCLSASGFEIKVRAEINPDWLLSFGHQFLLIST